MNSSTPTLPSAPRGSAGAVMHAKDSGGPEFPLKMFLTGSQITFLHSTTPAKFAFAEWVLISLGFFSPQREISCGLGHFHHMCRFPTQNCGCLVTTTLCTVVSAHLMEKKQHLQHRYQTSTLKYSSEIQDLCASNFNVNKQRWPGLVHPLLSDIEGSSNIPFLLWVRV